MPISDSRRPDRARRALVLVALVAAGAASYALRVGESPPGFHLDESSIALNAHAVAGTGRDEHGASWPLFFRAFGEYKNPVYVYVLAGVFRVTGPGIVPARLLSAGLVVGAALALALLAWRVSRRADVAFLTGLSALLTPWLFELGHVVLEIAIYPLAVALFLLAVRRASGESRWSWGDAAAIAAALALLTYGSSIGRLLGPLLALSLACFVTRERPFAALRAWIPYALFLVPLALFHQRHPGALTGRFRSVSYLDPERGAAALARDFLEHLAANLDPRRLLLTGDPSPHQVAHLPDSAPLLAATFALALLGAWSALRSEGVERRWWIFVACGLVAAFVPASLTVDGFHTLRLAAVPVFLLVVTIPGWTWLLSGGRGFRVKRGIALLLVAGGLAQAAAFQLRYHAEASTPNRRHLFDADYERWILDPALASSERPIHLADAPAIPGYVQALWHATRRGVPRSAFNRLPSGSGPPSGGLVITTEPPGSRGRILASVPPYTLYVAR